MNSTKAGSSIGSGDQLSDASQHHEPSLCDPQPSVEIHVFTTGTPLLDIAAHTKIFHVLKDFLCYHSNQFWTLYSDPGARNRKEWRIEFVSPMVFGWVLKWMYTQEITKPEEPRISYNEAIQLWLLAELLGMSRLQDATILYLEHSRTLHRLRPLPPAFLQYVYSATHEDSLIRRYIADTWDEYIQQEDAKLYPQSLLIELLNARTRKAKGVHAIEEHGWFIHRSSSEQMPAAKVHYSVARGNKNFPKGPVKFRRGKETSKERALRRQLSLARARVQTAKQLRNNAGLTLAHRITKASDTASVQSGFASRTSTVRAEAW